MIIIPSNKCSLFSFLVLRHSRGIEQLLHSPSGTMTDGKFGSSVAIGRVSGHMVIGGKNAIKAYVYAEFGDAWSCTAILSGQTTAFGKHVDVYDETIVVSDHSYIVGSAKGHVYVYKLISGELQLL